MLLTFTTIASASDEALSFPFNADSGKYWQYVSDRVMGGVSDGQVTLEQDGEMYYASKNCAYYRRKWNGWQPSS